VTNTEQPYHLENHSSGSAVWQQSNNARIADRTRRGARLLGLDLVVAKVHLLRFQRAQETLHDRTVPAVPQRLLLPITPLALSRRKSASLAYCPMRPEWWTNAADGWRFQSAICGASQDSVAVSCGQRNAFGQRVRSSAAPHCASVMKAASARGDRPYGTDSAWGCPLRMIRAIRNRPRGGPSQCDAVFECGSS
jgi:hypothetical protein